MWDEFYFLTEIINNKYINFLTHLRIEIKMFKNKKQTYLTIGLQISSFDFFR